MHHPTSSQLLIPNPGDTSQPSSLLPLYFSPPQILVANSLLVLSFIWTQISMSEVFPPSPCCLTTPESEEKPGCSSGKSLGKPCWPWVVSLENLSAILRWFCPTYHIRSPAKHRGLTRISLDFLRIAMNSFFFFNVSKHKICAWHPAE